MSDIQKNLAAIYQEIRAYELKYHRTPNSVNLLAVSKGRSVEAIKDAYAAGQRVFGESYLQEALTKISALSFTDMEWHFIGPIQSNKTKGIAENFSWVHSVSHAKILQRLHDQRPPTLSPLNICLQVNISNEASKSGVKPEEIVLLARQCETFSHLKLRGLMAIPEPTDDVTKQRAQFHAVRTIWETCHDEGLMLDTLSMGMSHDFEAAIAEGSTVVRIGTAIFC